MRAVLVFSGLAALALPCAALAQGSVGTPVPHYYGHGTSLTQMRFDTASTMIHHGRYTAAIDKATQALDQDSSFDAGYLVRAEWEIQAGRYADADADIARFDTMHPNGRSTYFLRAELALYRGDGAAAQRSLAVVAKLPYQANDPGFMGIYGKWSDALYFADRSIAEAMLHQDDPAIADLQNTINTEALNVAPILNHYCYTAAVGGQLDLAELACQESIKKQWGDFQSAYDSLGFTELKKHAWTQALDAYNKALARQAGLSTSLYGRGIARLATGDTAGGRADLADARDAEPNIDAIMRSLGAPSEADVRK